MVGQHRKSMFIPLALKNSQLPWVSLILLKWESPTTSTFTAKASDNYINIVITDNKYVYDCIEVFFLRIVIRPSICLAS